MKKPLIKDNILKKNSNDFLVLIGILTFWLIGYMYSMHRQNIQIILVILLGVIYTVWGVWHHRNTKFALISLLLEYASMGLLIVALFGGYLIIFNF